MFFVVFYQFRFFLFEVSFVSIMFSYDKRLEHDFVNSYL